MNNDRYDLERDGRNKTHLHDSFAVYPQLPRLPLLRVNFPVIVLDKARLEIGQQVPHAADFTVGAGEIQHVRAGGRFGQPVS